MAERVVELRIGVGNVEVVAQQMGCQLFSRLPVPRYPEDPVGRLVIDVPGCIQVVALVEGG